jgi:hypothetical protein
MRSLALTHAALAPCFDRAIQTFGDSAFGHRALEQAAEKH